MRFIPFLLIISFLLAGCAAPASRWREDAFSRFNSAVSAGSQQFAPEETDNIRQTLALADRYFAQRLTEDAERLFRLSCQKSQLLYRNLVLSKVRQGATLAVQSDEANPPEVIELAAEPVSMKAAFEQALREQVQEKPLELAVPEQKELPVAAVVISPSVEPSADKLTDKPRSAVIFAQPVAVSTLPAAPESVRDVTVEVVLPAAGDAAVVKSGVGTDLNPELALAKELNDKPGSDVIITQAIDLPIVPTAPESIRAGATGVVQLPAELSAAVGSGDTSMMPDHAAAKESPAELPLPGADKVGSSRKVADVVRSGVPDEVPTSPHTIERIPPAKAVVKKQPKPSSVPRHSDPASTTIYLTFDDGPSRLTVPIAGFLKTQGVAATFFALGSNIKGHEQVIKETVALGHRVGNHTLSHNLKKLNGSLHQSTNEIEKTAAMLEKLGGDGKMVRIPYGAANRALVTTVAAEGGQIFDWDINSLDSSKRGAKDSGLIEKTVLQQLQKSGKRHIVLLFHDGAGHEATLTAIRRLVPRLKQEGYRFGLLSRNDRVARARQESVATP
jgi:peptidoglycan/xylan/chitin deacetylase (PgdA/CDA1 family)